jgi:hypothetical protein
MVVPEFPQNSSACCLSICPPRPCADAVGVVVDFCGNQAYQASDMTWVSSAKRTLERSQQYFSDGAASTSARLVRLFDPGGGWWR